MVSDDKQSSSSTPPEEGISALDRLLKRIYGTEEFPTISKYIIEINRKLTVNPDDSNATDLANIILKDHALTSKLLKMVNSAFYGLAAGKVSTITRAVVVLGYENVRLATLSLALFENFKGQTSSNPLKEMVVGSFWSGMMARQLAAMQGRVDPEEAFVCSMMSHLGKLVMLYHLPEDYRKIRKTMVDEGVGEDKAMRLVCEVSYDELGMAVAKQWNFPFQICESMHILSRGELRNRKKSPEPLRVVTSFVKEVCNAIQADSSAASPKRLQTILERYESQLRITKKDLKTLVKGSLENVHEHAQALSLNITQSAFLERLSAIYDPPRRASAAKELPPVPDQSGESFHLKDEDQLKAAARIATTRNPSDIIMEGIQELSQIMMADYDVETIAVMSLEIVYRALDFNRALMFVKDGNRNRMSARFGYGHHCQRLVNNLDFELGPAKDLFNLSIQVGKDLIVADSYDEKMTHLIPAWYRKKIDAPSFVFLPITLQKVCIGALYADRDTEGLPINETEHRYLGMLRNQFILSIKYKQKSA
jgi:HD-like signal output (HDOD) protein